MNIKAFSIFLLLTQVNTVASLVSQGEDSTLYFKLNGGTFSCDMVRNAANTRSLCAAGGPISGDVSTHCPATCGVTDSDMRFPVLLERPIGSGVYEDVWKQCSWVKKNPDETCAKCEKEGVRGTCVQTCSNCPPTMQRTPGPGGSSDLSNNGSHAWDIVVNNADPIPDVDTYDGKNFSSYNAPSVNKEGFVVFRARSTG